MKTTHMLLIALALAAVLVAGLYLRTGLFHTQSIAPEPPQPETNYSYEELIEALQFSEWGEEMWSEFGWSRANADEFTENLLGEWRAYCPRENIALIGCAEVDIRTRFDEDGRVTLRVATPEAETPYSDLRYRWLIESAGANGAAGLMGEFEPENQRETGAVDYVFLMRKGDLVFFQIELLELEENPSLLIFKKLPPEQSQIPSSTPDTPGHSVGEGDEN